MAAWMIADSVTPTTLSAAAARPASAPTNNAARAVVNMAVLHFCAAAINQFQTADFLRMGQFAPGERSLGRVSKENRLPPGIMNVAAG